MTIDVISAKLSTKSKMTLPKDFSQKGSLYTLAQALRVYENRSHIGLVIKKGRSEVNRTTAKVYKQKGTGHARHGSRSAPIYVGGGMAHAPKTPKRVLSLLKKNIEKARKIALFIKIEEKGIVAVSGIASIKKTKEAQSLINKISKDGKATVILSQKNIPSSRFFKNLEGTKVVPYKDLNARDIYLGGKLIFDKEIFAK